MIMQAREASLWAAGLLATFPLIFVGAGFMFFAAVVSFVFRSGYLIGVYEGHEQARIKMAVETGFRAVEEVIRGG